MAYINREQVLEICEKHYQHCLEMHDWNGDSTADNIKRDIEALPIPAFAEVKHGEWEMRGGRRYCSVCRERACVTRDMEDYWYTEGTDYCPNCGAKMDGGK